MNYYFNFNVIQRNFVEMLAGLGLGLWLAVISLFFAVLLGVFIAFGAVASQSILRRVAKSYITLFRNTPLLVLVYIVYFGLPDLGFMLGKKESFVFTLALYGAAYMAEVFRAGLEGIHPGIIEAGKAIGLPNSRIIFDIKIPIMFRSVLPSMGNYLISLFKDTALAAAITVPELTYITRKYNTTTFRTFELWFTTALMYVVACYTISFVLRRIENKLKIH